MTIDVQLLISEAGVVFDGGEQFAADLPSYPAGQEVLQQRFEFAQIAQGQQSNTLIWLANKGQCKIGERTFIIDSANGNSRKLSVGVHGKSAEAFDVLQELWTRLVECERSLTHPGPAESAGGRPEPVGRIQSFGQTFVVTTAVVKLPFRVEQLFPQADFLREEVKNALDTTFRISREPTVRFSLDVRLDWGTSQRNVTSTITFEPRAGDKLDSKVFFTRSPLSSDDHLKIVESFVARFSPPVPE